MSKRNAKRNKCKYCLHYMGSDYCDLIHSAEVNLTKEEFKTNQALGECAYFTNESTVPEKRVTWISIN